MKLLRLVYEENEKLWIISAKILHCENLLKLLKM